MRVVGFLLTLLVLAAPASANWQEDRALEVAKVVWHSPCVDRATFVVVPQQVINGDVKLAPGDAVAARGDAVNCVIQRSDGFNNSDVTWWWQWCTIVLHESGHLAGYRDPANVADPFHSLNPNSIMYWRAKYDHRCDDRGRPFLEKHGVLAPRHLRRGVVEG